jgi:hypothetical protein
VPPGYFVLGSTVTKCPTNITVAGLVQGYYRAGWAMYSDPAVTEPASGNGSSACEWRRSSSVGALCILSHSITGMRHLTRHPRGLHGANGFWCSSFCVIT